MRKCPILSQHRGMVISCFPVCKFIISGQQQLKSMHRSKISAIIDISMTLQAAAIKDLIPAHGVLIRLPCEVKPTGYLNHLFDQKCRVCNRSFVVHFSA